MALVPGAALADHDERSERRSSWRDWNEERHERRDDRHERRVVHVHRHGPSCGHRDVRFYSPTFGRLYNPFGAVRWPAPFFCRPCGHYFHDRAHFHQHVHASHHVPLWAVPRFVTNVGPGWIYYHD
jgi:hypothetical protein